MKVYESVADIEDCPIENDIKDMFLLLGKS